jgi:hypothetical protein
MNKSVIVWSLSEAWRGFHGLPPGTLVDRIVKGSLEERFEQRTVRQRERA